MDPITVNRIARIRQQEILEWALKDQAGRPTRPWLRQLGSLFVRIGQKMMQAADFALEEQADEQPAATAETCASRFPGTGECV